MSKTNLQNALNNLLEFQKLNGAYDVQGQEFFKAAIKQIHGALGSYGLPPAPAWEVIERDRRIIELENILRRIRGAYERRECLADVGLMVGLMINGTDTETFESLGK